jgi:hypothetical protein
MFTALVLAGKLLQQLQLRTRLRNLIKVQRQVHSFLQGGDASLKNRRSGGGGFGVLSVYWRRWRVGCGNCKLSYASCENRFRCYGQLMFHGFRLVKNDNFSSSKRSMLLS